MDCARSPRKDRTACWRHILSSLAVLTLSLFIALPVWAMNFDLAGKPLKISGFYNQGVGYGIADDTYDHMEGFQSFKYDVLVEAEYNPHQDIKIFVSGMLSGDFAYDILNDDSDWKNKGFSDSRNNLSHDTVLRDLLQEAHVTWNVGDFLFRVGKQIVVWGETDGIRLMDQINPLDQRRGNTDVEFESSVMPIWMLRTDYFFNINSSWLEDLGLEFVFNPNADFVPERSPFPGNENVGIWAADIPVPLAPGVIAHMGSFDENIVEPDEWDPDGFEYGVRLKAIAWDALITLNYFYGRDNNPAAIFIPAFPRIEGNAFDSQPVIHLARQGHYPLLRFVGATFSRDFESLNLPALGGVAPVVRMEGLFGFSNTFSSNLPPGLDHFDQYDEFRYAIGIDWKIKIPWLNPRAYFTLMPQFYHRHIIDYPNDHKLVDGSGPPVPDDTYMTTFRIATTYFHNKLEPSFVWVGDHSYDSGFYIPQLKYEYSDKWNFTLGTAIYYGDDKLSTASKGEALHKLRNKDHVYFTVGYRF
jgi:hypothetical protein